jgi:hypothetical protein
MNLVLSRLQNRQDGIFGDIFSEYGELIAQTLEHAYDGPMWRPKIPSGTYKCVRSLHRLHGMTEDFETFEITGVEGHTNLLFHWGCFNSNSEGCVLLGLHVERGPDQTQMLTHSREAFAKFMTLQEGVKEFTLTVH